MDQIQRELLLIGGIAGFTFLIYLAIRKQGETLSMSGNRLLCGLVGTFLLLGGIAKFFMPFTEMFAQQIALSNLRFPRLSAFAGQVGEITAGIVLFVFFLAWSRLQGRQAGHVFVLANLLVVIIMTVAVYVHLHPDVPAEVLPFQSKPPVVTLLIMGLAILNVWLRHRSQRV
jgi:hypothetical protein